MKSVTLMALVCVGFLVPACGSSGPQDATGMTAADLKGGHGSSTDAGDEDGGKAKTHGKGGSQGHGGGCKPANGGSTCAGDDDGGGDTEVGDDDGGPDDQGVEDGGGHGHRGDGGKD